MRAGTAASLTAHAAVIACGLFSLTTAHPLDTSAIEAIPVSFVEIGAVTSLPKATPVPPPKPAPAPVAEAKPVPPIPTPAPALARMEASAPPAKPATTAAVPALAPSPKPVAEATAPTTVASVAPPTPPKPRVAPPAPAAKPTPAMTETLDSDEIVALLDKSRPPPQPAKPPPDTLALGSLIASNAVDPHMTATEVDALRARIAACWTPPLGWLDPAEVRVVLIIALNRDGSVGGPPEVVEAPAGRYQQTAPESAVRAVRLCAPYALPAETYEDWREVKITFDPKAMGTG